ncbi:MAG TPA: serine/threonine-protein kinase [Thermoanaerobaculia bacterium]|nr:serine/threonine-protein kinase [Thermoanaerobaculia bacterium]
MRRIPLGDVRKAVPECGRRPRILCDNPRMSDREEWERIEPLLDQAFELEGAELIRFLDEVGREDPRVRRKLEQYLGATEHGTVLVDLPLHRVAGSLVDRLELDRLDATLAPGRTLGSFRIVAELGEGGMGRVYLAEREGGEPGERVALKVLNRSHADRDEMQQRFERERQILANLDHPGIARVLDAGVTSDGRPYFALEYVEGRNLLDYCVQRGLALEARVRLFVRVCEAVHYAHQRGVVHRDLKPSNLLVAESAGAEPRVCVLDFGIARREKTHEITLTGQIMGTPGYMSPEQARGRTALVDHRADVFSLGVILYELIGGRKPFDGKTPADVLLSLVDDDPLPLAGREISVPQGLERVVLRCLAKDPADRYDDVALLAADLERSLTGKAPLLGRSPGEWRWRDLGRRFGGAMVVAGLALVALVALGIAAWQQVRTERMVARRAAAYHQRGEELVAELTELRRAPRAAGETRHETYVDAAEELSRAATYEQGAVAAAAHQAAGLMWQELAEPERARRQLELALAGSERRDRAVAALDAALLELQVLELALGTVEHVAAEYPGGFDAGPARDASNDGALGVGDGLLLAALSERPGDGAGLAEAVRAYRLEGERSPGDPRPLERLCVVNILRGSRDAADAGNTNGTGPCIESVSLAPRRWQPRALVAIEQALRGLSLPQPARGLALAAAADASAEAVAAAPGSVLAHRARAALQLLAASHAERGAQARVESAVGSLQTAVAAAQAASAIVSAPSDEPRLQELQELQERLGRARLAAARLASGAEARSAAELAVEALRSAGLSPAAPHRALAVAEACALRAEQELGRGPAARDWAQEGLVALEQAERNGVDPVVVHLARVELWTLAGRQDQLAGIDPVDAEAAAALARGILDRDAGVERARVLLARAELVRARHSIALAMDAGPSIAIAREALAQVSAAADTGGVVRAELIEVTLLAGGATVSSGLAREAESLASAPGAAVAARLAPARVALAAAVRGVAQTRRLEQAETVLRQVLAAHPHDAEALFLMAAAHLERALGAATAPGASVEIWRGIDAAERARLERPAWAEPELLLARLHGALAEHKSGAERREALRQAEASERRAAALNPLLAARELPYARSGSRSTSSSDADA